MRRKFTKKQQQEIAERDKYCLLCGSNLITDIHHIFYGTHRPAGWKKTDDINGTWNGAALCRYDHDGFHHTGKFRNKMSINDNRILLETFGQSLYDHRTEI